MSTNTLQEFFDHPRMAKASGWHPHRDRTVEDLLAAGVTARDLYLYRSTSKWVTRTDPAQSMATELGYVAVRHAHLPLADATAWLIVGDQVASATYALVDQWAHQGPAEALAPGWRFAAAGVAPREAAAMLGPDGQVPVAELALMTSLRGVALPSRA